MLPIDRSLSDALVNALVGQLREVGDTRAGESALMRWLMALAKTVFSRFLERLDEGPCVELDGETWFAACRSNRTYETRFGAVTIERNLYRSERNGPTRCLVEERAGIILGGWTSDAARLACLLLSNLSSRTAASFLAEMGGLSPSRTKLQNLPSKVHALLEPARPEVEDDLRLKAEIPTEAVSVAVSLDGVMVKEQISNRGERVEAAREAGRKVGGPIGSTEASVGSLSFYDVAGDRLATRRFARMPEAGKVTLKSILRAELAHIREQRPDLVVVALSDGAPNHWSFLSDLEPDHEVVDAYHVLEHVKRRLDRTLGVNSHATQAAYSSMKETLLTVENGHTKVFAKLVAIEKKHGKHKPRKTVGRGAQPTFYERHSGRMRFLELRSLKLPIGSGVIEGTARYMVVDRLRRTGMRWKSTGGQAILTLRQHAANDQFNEAWSHVERLAAA